MAVRIDWLEANEVCDALSEEGESLTREIMNRLSDKWMLWTMAELAAAEAPMRFSRLMERVEGVSQKSLTKVLRQLERDGLVTREVFAEVPPRVEYAITELALEMLDLMHPVWKWTTANLPNFQAAHAAYDLRQKAQVKRG